MQLLHYNSLHLSESAGSGRKVRNAQIPSGKLTDIRVLADTSAVEIYLNDGEVVFSTKYYPESLKQNVKVDAESVHGRIYRLNFMTYTEN